MTTALIVLPLAAALVVWLLPLPGRAAGGLALLAALAELTLWAVVLGGFDFEQGLQLENQRSWFSDLDVSYHVGLYGFSLWLTGLAIVVCRRRSATRSGPAGSAGAPTTGCCSSSPVRLSVCSRPRICCSSTSSSRRC